MKNAIRKKISGVLESVTPEELDRMSENIKLNLFSLPEFMDAKSVMFYASKGAEVRTDDMIRDAIAAGKTVALPCAVTKEKRLLVYEVRDIGTDLSKGAYGIREPRTEYCREMKAEDIDVVIVPGKAFDTRGERIGYGMGFYDRFLAGTGDATAIGLAYDFQIVDEVPSEGHDARVSMIVTNSKIIRTPESRERLKNNQTKEKR